MSQQQVAVSPQQQWTNQSAATSTTLLDGQIPKQAWTSSANQQPPYASQANQQPAFMNPTSNPAGDWARVSSTSVDEGRGTWTSQVSHSVSCFDIILDLMDLMDLIGFVSLVDDLLVDE